MLADVAAVAIVVVYCIYYYCLYVIACHRPTECMYVCVHSFYLPWGFVSSFDIVMASKLNSMRSISEQMVVSNADDGLERTHTHNASATHYGK